MRLVGMPLRMCSTIACEPAMRITSSPSARPSTNPPSNWSTNHWRNDRRYDWYKHRNKYWWLFQLGWYSDPFGWIYDCERRVAQGNLADGKRTI